jgi:arylsulfatase A-like enzyme
MLHPSARHISALFGLLATACVSPGVRPAPLPNVVLIYADDLGYGDVSSYGATRITTPNIDRLAAEGLRFTDAHSPAATCTPSRYAMLTGEYAWRRAGTGIARGDAPLIIPTNYTTLPAILKRAGYATAVVGKWHLGLGPESGPDWNGDLSPGPLDLGFDYAYLLPATGDRVPTVYVENRRVVGLDPSDPIQVSFSGPVGDEPTGAARPDLLRMHPSHGHDQTIVNGISRIGYMAGGRAARWVDEDMADHLAGKAVSYIEAHQDEPFFLYFSTHDIHVPRTPHPRFAGASGLGPRGDATLQLDWSVGEILGALDRLGLASNTLVIFTSDNGPVLDDGYVDQAVELASGHDPSGGFRGGKYSAFEAGTRVPFIVRWPARVARGLSSALVSQIDFMASLASLSGVALDLDAAPDSHDVLPALLGDSPDGRDHLVEQAGPLSIVQGRWKLVEAHEGPAVNRQVNIELGNAAEPQLYDLQADPAERQNVAAANPDVVNELTLLLQRIREQGRSR